MVPRDFDVSAISPDGNIEARLSYQPETKKCVRFVASPVGSPLKKYSPAVELDLYVNGPSLFRWPPSLRRASFLEACDLYFADSNRIRKVSGGVITTVAGNGTDGFSGDDGPAISTQLNFHEEVAVDSAGNLYIADAVTLASARSRGV